MKNTMTMSEIYDEAADTFRVTGNLTPSHCDVRCLVNDLLDGYEKSGFRVNHGYSQNRAFRAVRRLLKK